MDKQTTDRRVAQLLMEIRRREADRARAPFRRERERRAENLQALFDAYERRRRLDA
jgi:hypothetical protein